MGEREGEDRPRTERKGQRGERECMRDRDRERETERERVGVSFLRHLGLPHIITPHEPDATAAPDNTYRHITHTHTRTRRRTHTHTHTRTHRLSHTHTHTHKQTHTHIHTHRPSGSYLEWTRVSPTQPGGLLPEQCLPCPLSL